MKRPVLVFAAGVLAGLAAGAIWTWAQSDRFRADARMLVRPTSARLVPAVSALAESSLVETNVAQTLRLSSPPTVSARAGQGGVLTMSVEAGSRERARQIDAEAVVILTQKVPQRFAGASVTVLDPAHVAEQTSPTPGRNLLILGLVGLAAGLAAAALMRRSTPAPETGDVDPRRERELRARIDEVTKRELALARRAGELAARERELERTQPPLVVEPLEPAPEPEPGPELKLEPEPEPEPEPLPAPTPPSPALGSWNIEELERFVRDNRERAPQRVEEWETYLFFLREHANVDGSLPRSFDSLVAEVFG